MVNQDAEAIFIRQQDAFAKFGEMALRSDDLSEILHEACRLVGDALGTDLSKVMELQEDRKTLIMRAGVGWGPGVIGEATVKVETGSSEGYALQTGDPVISPNISSETRFKYAKFIQDAGVKAIANVIVPGRLSDRPYGILQIDSRRPRDFTNADVTFLRGYANLLGAAVDRVRVSFEEHVNAERLSIALESTTDSVILVDSNWNITYLNQHALDLLGIEKHKANSNFWSIFLDKPEGQASKSFHTALTEQKVLVFEDYFPRRRLWLEIRAYPTSGGLSIFFRDISFRRATEKELQIAQDHAVYLSRHDGLTGLPNRAALHDRLETLLTAARPEAGLAVLYLDLDGFKGINDRLGHQVGDDLLKEVAVRLTGCIRGGDIAARIGGDEFAILEKNLDSPDGASVLAKRLVQALGLPYALDGQQFTLSASVGITTAFDNSVDVIKLLKRADLAMYSAKLSGGGTYSFFGNQMTEKENDRQILKQDLRKAIDQQQFELYYQPILDLITEKVVCLEALLRWHHPKRGLISPGDFISIAEESGIILIIGEWVLLAACLEAVKWNDTISLAVNLSPVQFRDSNLVQNVKETLIRTGLAPNRLEFEITESALLLDSDANLFVLHALKEIGVRISMDDFGTGYSSLTYLRSFPFDKIKVDRSFVSDLPDGNGADAIVHAVAVLGRSFNLTTTAEGVETREQLECLRSEGYDQVQGYLFSKPVQSNQLHTMDAVVRF
ncbi:EAL domain-containing protein (plasmid) [Lichenicola cladoniae]|uniref:EAL domain-containing protein n=1 Tax=Lichenicola cladoniae TaxID=1484109 RepID=A0A6M8HX15_9PROT|nr:EAL domain-containing protein [Lichenicola cladoniae]NPD68991.1 EAL domain-containing protein [Acetobacteraceae bacterium]QKE92890.1 EAL domain-containing protein [Lichenicola cladoniae]